MKSSNEKSVTLPTISSDDVSMRMLPSIRDSLAFVARHPSDVIGNWGPVQKRLLFVLILCYIIGPLNNASIVFYAPKYDFFCNYIDDDTGAHVSLKNKCEYRNARNETKQCTKFTYDDSLFKKTLVSEFDLVCGRSHYGSVAQSLHQAGYMMSGIFIGHMSDRYGRRFAGLCAILMEIAAGFGQALAPTIHVYWFFRFFQGMAAYGRFLASYVLITEWIGPKFRAPAASAYEYGWHTGALILPAIFYALPDFRLIQSGVSAVQILSFIAFFVVVWESPRWLLTHGRILEAEVTLTTAAVARDKLSDEEIGKRISSIVRHVEKEVMAEDASKQTILDAWRVPRLRRLSVILFFSWFTMAFLYNAFTLNLQNLGGNLFVNFAVFAFVDMVAHTFLLMIINRCSRKSLFDAALLIQIASLFCLLAVSFGPADDLLIYRLIASACFRIGMTISYEIIYLYTAETFPTCMR